jgi:hypothetical protein
MGRPAVESSVTRCISKLPLVRDEATRSTLPLKSHTVSLRTFFSDFRSKNKEAFPAPEPPKGHKKSVSFASVEIRSYSQVIGDHPCCTMGCPLSLGWDYKVVDVLSLDRYEETRYPRLSRDALRTSSEERRQILTAGNVSETEMRRAERRLNRSRSCSAKLCERVSDSFFGEGISTQCEG